MTPRQIKETCRNHGLSNKKISQALKMLTRNPRWSFAKVNAIEPDTFGGMEVLDFVHYTNDCWGTMDVIAVEK